jgi:hypothetical protein
MGMDIGGSMLQNDLGQAVLFFRIVVSECLLLFEGACSINSDFLEY